MFDKIKNISRAYILSDVCNGVANTRAMLFLIKKIAMESSFSSKIKKFPAICFGEKEFFSEKENTSVRGFYRFNKDKIILNGNYYNSHDILSFLYLLDTISHELTHHYQKEKGYALEADISAKEFEDVINFMDVKDAFGSVNFQALYYSRYFQKEDEVEARKGAYDFIKEANRYFEKNEYIKGFDKFRLCECCKNYLCQLENEEKEYEKIFAIYTDFKNRWRNIGLNDYIFKEKEEGCNFELLKIALLIRIDSASKDEIFKDYYLALINRSYFIMEIFQDCIKGKRFSEKDREKIKEQLMDFFMKKENFYLYNDALDDFLDAEQIALIYRRFLTKNISKMVEENTFNKFQSSKKGCLKAIDSFIFCYKNKLIKINSYDDLVSVKATVKKFLIVGEDYLDSKRLKDLFEIRKSVDKIIKERKIKNK